MKFVMKKGNLGKPTHQNPTRTTKEKTKNNDIFKTLGTEICNENLNFY
jgi:hypothetical protein